MVADVPGYTPFVNTMLPAADEYTECILSPKHQKEFDCCMNDGTETVTVPPKPPIPIHRLAPGTAAQQPHQTTPVKALPTEVRGDVEST